MGIQTPETRALFNTPPLDEGTGLFTRAYQQFFLKAIADIDPFWDFAGVSGAGTGTSGGGAPSGVIVGTHAERAGYPAGAFPQGTIYYETDRTTFYMVIAGAWAWVAGRYSAALSAIPTLSTADAGFVFYVTDYDHTLIWSGSAWGYGSGERSGYIESFLVDPSPTTGWSVCDGSTVSYLKSDGTTSSVTLPNLTGNPAYLKLGASASATINPAVAPGFTDPVFSGNPVTPTGTVGAASGSFSVSAGVANTVSLASHTHALNMNSLTPTGTNSGGAVDDTGEPQNVVMKAWFRR